MGWRRGYSIIGLVGGLVFAAAGCTSDVSEQRVSEPDRTSTSTAHADQVTVTRIEYPTVDDADTEQNWADLYLPTGSEETDTVPLVVLIHGGSWQSHLGADVFDPLARDLAARGMAVYNVEYRRVGSGGGWPTTFRDIASALDHVVDVDKQYPQLTTDDELVVGHSAGAQLAVWGGTRHKLENDEVGSKPEFRPTRVVSLAGPLDMRYAATHGDDRIVTVLGGTPDEVPDRYTSVDPIQNIDPDTPVIAMHGSADTVVTPTNSRRYVQAVEREDGNASLVLLPDIDHAAIVSSDAPSYEHVLDVITETSDASLDELDEE